MRREISGLRLRFDATWKCKTTNRVLCEAGRGGTDIAKTRPISGQIRTVSGRTRTVDLVHDGLSPNDSTLSEIPAIKLPAGEQIHVRGRDSQNLGSFSGYGWGWIRSAAQGHLLHQRLQFCAGGAGRKRAIHRTKFGFLQRDFGKIPMQGD